MEGTALKILFAGAGALGSTIGGVLAEGGNEVWLINRDTAHVDAINAHGLRMRDGTEERVVQVRASAGYDGIGPVDLVVVLVKSYDTETVVRAAKPVIGPNTVVMSLQNGLGHEEVLADIVGRDRVLAGKTYTGGVLLGQGHVLIGTKGKETIIGELDGSVSDRTKAIAEAFRAAGLETEISTNIVGTMWDKLFINIAGGGITAITRLTYGGMYSLPEMEQVGLSAIQEAMDVARAAGVTISTADPRQAWLKAGAGLSPQFKTSMLQSMERDAPTEVDYIHGSVVRWGQRTGVPTPVNSTIVALVKGIEYARTDYPGKA